ncbi:MAG: nodulation protein NfeD [Chloroflexi bacterium]|nr:nodulation protein NfeD [Chloroflexota bacterium]
MSIKRLVFILLFSLCFVMPAAAQRGEETVPTVVVLEVNGPIGAPMAEYISRGIRIAEERSADALVLTLDTPGGTVDTTFRIVREMRASEVPIIVYVAPRGATAGSAGLLITLAGHASGMAPETAIGASSPVRANGGDIGGTLEQKQQEILAAEARSLATGRGEGAETIASDAIFEARAVSASEAVEANLVDAQADSLPELLAALDGLTVEVEGEPVVLRVEDAVLERVGMNIIEAFLMLLINPNVVVALFLMGLAAVIAEIFSPGGWVAGAFGVVCLGFALYGFGTLPVNGLGIVFILLAVGLFVLEATTSTFGILAGTGIVSLIVGLALLFNRPGIEAFGEISAPFIVATGVLATIFLAAYLSVALGVRQLPPSTGREGLIGLVGRVVDPLTPEGMVLVHGERWRAESEDRTTVNRGARVEVVSVEGLRLVVRPAERH